MSLALQPGSVLLHYRVVAPLGAGGMGEVYRAVDTALGREVAIKVLPTAFAADAERLARFEREARLLASLNHPNIAAVYGLHELAGNRFLAMELVSGESLAARLARGALELDEALAVARQIADALAAAHEQGVIHRDLKPANVQLAADGRVKVLDFGLAKGLEAGSSSAAELAHSPTITFGATVEGTILGTAAYMSPEQARGRPVDRRADVWAFGCVLWEMLTGRRLFGGDSVPDTLAAVLRADPDWSALPADTPRALRRLLQRCLERDPGKRLRDLADARLDLDETPPTEAPAASTAIAPPPPFARLPWALAASAFAVALLAVGWAVATRRTATAAANARAIRFAISDPPLASVTPGAPPRLALSADGERLFWMTVRGGRRVVATRAVAALDTQIVPGSEGVQGIAAVAPDGARVAVAREGSIEWLALRGGAPERQARAGGFRGAALAADGSLWLAPNTESGLVRVARGDSAPAPIITPDPAAMERSFRWPALLPGGEVVLFTAASAELQSFAEARIEAYSTRTRRRTVVVERASYPLVRAPDLLYFVRSGGLFEARLDLASLELASEPRLVQEGVGDDLLAGSADVALAGDGTLAYAPGGARTIPRRLLEVSRDGAARPIAPEAEPYQRLGVSPDGKSIAVDIDAAGAQLWLIDRERGTRVRLTRAWSNNYPVFARDGQSVFYASAHGARPRIWEQRLDGGAAVPRLEAEFAIWPMEVSPDGERLLYERWDGVQADLWELPLDGASPPRPLVESAYNERAGRFSPDGRWLAYSSDESGRYEVYVQPMPGPGRKTRVSTEGGQFPLWNPDGREIVFRGDAGNEILASRVTLGAEVAVERPRLWAKLDGFDFAHEMLPDGKLVVVLDPGESTPPPIVVARGWERPAAGAGVR